MRKTYRNVYGWPPNVRGGARLMLSGVWECQLERTRPDLKRGALERVGGRSYRKSQGGFPNMRGIAHLVVKHVLVCRVGQHA